MGLDKSKEVEELTKLEKELKDLMKPGTRTEEVILKARKALFDKDYLLYVINCEVEALERKREERINNSLESTAETLKKLEAIIKEFDSEGLELYSHWLEENNNSEYLEKRCEEDRQTYKRLLDQIGNGITQTEEYKEIVLYITATDETGQTEEEVANSVYTAFKEDFYSDFSYFVCTGFTRVFSEKLFKEGYHVADTFPATARISDRVFDLNSLLFTMLRTAPADENEEIRRLSKRTYIKRSFLSEYSYNNLTYPLIHSTRSALGQAFKGAVKITGTEEAEENIQALSQLEKLVLDTIIRYFKSGTYVFTNGNIATDIYGTDKHTLEQLEAIDRAIDKLRSTFIEVIGVSGEKDSFYNSRNPFIHVENIGKRTKDTNVQTYRIIGVPFYHVYTERTNGRYIAYRRSVLTKEIVETSKRRGLKKTPSNTALRAYLIESTVNALQGLTKAFIGVEGIYNASGAITRKQKKDVRERAKIIFAGLMEDYPELKGVTEIKQGVEITGYKLTIKKAG